MRRGLGYLPDLPKAPDAEPDWLASKVLKTVAIPFAHTNVELIVETLDQLNLGSCVTNAGFGIIRMSHVKQGIAKPKLGSRRAGYYLSRAYHHMTQYDSGTHLRTFFESCNKFGFAAEELDPYIIERFADMPPTKYFQAAFDQKSPTVYRRIASTGNDRLIEVKTAIVNQWGVAFGVDVGEDFVEGDFDANEPVMPPTHRAGGHAMYWYGFEGDVFLTKNSWGTDFGFGGSFKMAPEYVLDARDIWIAEHAPRYAA